jgi:hypothetical protein
LRLENHFAIMTKAKPFHIFQYRIDMLRPTPRAVNILDPQQEFSAKGAGKIMRAHRRKGMADMQPPIGTGRKARRADPLRRKFDSGYFTHRITISGGRCPLDVNLCRHNLADVKML